MTNQDLKNLLDRTIFEGCGDGQEDQNQKCRTQIDLTQLHTLLHTIIEGQSVMKLALGEFEERIVGMEDNLEEIVNEVSSTKEEKASSRRSSKSSARSSLTGKEPLPPIAKSSRSNVSLNKPRSSSLLELANSTVTNFAQKNDIDKLSTRLDLFQTKLDKLTDIVPSNEVLAQRSDSSENLGASEAWSKHVLTKRIESNEESLEKFTQLIDELSAKLRTTQKDIQNKIKDLKEQGASQGVEESINDVLDRLAQLESGTSKIDELQKKLAQVSKSSKDMKGSSEGKFAELSDGLKSLKSMVESLESQLKAIASQMSGIQHSVAIAQQQATSALQAASNATGVEAPPPPPPVLAPTPDLETIRALGELKSKLAGLTERVDNIPAGISMNDLDLMKASVLEEIPNYLNSSLETMREQLGALADKNDRLNEIVDLNLKRSEPEPAETPIRPRSAASRSELEKLASKAQLESVQKTLEDSTQRLDQKITGEIRELHEKIKASSGGMWDDLAGLKQQFGSFTEDLGALRSGIIQKINDIESGSGQGMELGGRNSLANVETLSPALTNLIDRLQKKQFELGESLTEVMGELANQDEIGRKRAVDIETLQQKLISLEEGKADKGEITRLDETKADRQEVLCKVSRDDFDIAMSDMSNQLRAVLGQMLEVEQNWKTSLDQTNDKLKNTMNTGEMNQFKQSLEARLKNLKTLLESSRMEESYEHGDCSDAAAVFRKPLLGYKCVSCDKITMPVPGAPVASIPVSGNLPHMRTIRPYTTFDLHTIRSQSKITKTGYEERMMLKVKQNIDKNYRQHVVQSLNNAFNAHEQSLDNNNTVPIGGGSSIPKNYQINKTGRSCGGGHTRTNPHIRFTHLKNLGEMWQEVDDNHNEQHIQQEVQQQEQMNNQAAEAVTQKLEESCREMQLVGNDGHVYRGRDATDHDEMK